MERPIDVAIMGGMYIFAGIMHFAVPKGFDKIVPPYIPKARLMVYLSGIAEIVFGAALFFESTRSYAAIGIILLLIAVFPANLYMAQCWRAKKHPYTWAAYARLPLQLVLIWWAWMYY